MTNDKGPMTNDKLRCFILCLILTPLSVGAALNLKPAAPQVDAGGEIRLSAEGAVEPVIWTASKGQINGSSQGTGAVITYTAPAEAGIAAITAEDAANQLETLAVIVLPAGDMTYAPENMRWKVYANRSNINVLLLSPDGAILWTGSNGGLEKRDSVTGRLLRVYTNRGFSNMNGLPDNNVQSLAIDSAGGLWAGTHNGLARLDADGVWTVYNENNANLPDNDVRSLAIDSTGRLWAGTSSGLARLDANGVWTMYYMSNSGLPHNFIQSLAVDGAGGLWAGTLDGGLARLDADGAWTVYDQNNSGLPDNWVMSLAIDGAGGLWAGTYGGLARLGADGAWTIYDQAELPNNWIMSLAGDGAGGLWAGIGGGGLARLGADGIWTVYDQAGLPPEYIQSLALDGAGGLWAGTDGSGLARLDTDGNWAVYDQNNTGPPGKAVRSIAIDSANGVWAGIDGSGLAHLGAKDVWTMYDKSNSGLPGNWIQSLVIDGAGRLWAGTRNSGLARLDADGAWTVYDNRNSGLPDNNIQSLAVDDAGRLWAGTERGGLARLDADGAWTVYDESDSIQLHHAVRALAIDGAGGVWTGTEDHGLVRLDTDGTWMVYDQRNSGLPDNDIHSIVINGTSRLWAGTKRDGLARLDADGTWTVYHAFYHNPPTAANSDLPSNYVRSLAVDSAGGGLWASTYYEGYSGPNHGLARLGADGAWTLYHADYGRVVYGIHEYIMDIPANADLPDYRIMSLADDGAGGLWAGTGRGLVRLSFGSDNLALVRQTGNSNLLTDKRAAIVIHPQGPELTGRDTSAIAFMAAHACRSLEARGYSSDEIYFLSAAPDMDIDGNSRPDHAVDAPVKFAEFRAGMPRRDLTQADLHAAFDWAAQQGALNQPLLLIFTGHGETDRLLLDAHGTTLAARELDTLLDNYQENTGNQVVVILEASHSGTLIPGLSGDDRLIITSTDSKRAYYDDLGALSFTRLFFDKLRDMNENRSFLQAFREVSAEFSSADSVFRRQRPQLDDNGTANPLDGILADSLCLNGCIGDLNGVSSDMTLAPETPAQTVTQGQKVTLAVRAVITNGYIRNVRAVILTPEAEILRSAHGFSLVPPVSVPLTRDPADSERWTGTFSGFTYRGNYIVKFLAEDRDGFFGPDASVTLTVEQGPEVPVAPVPNLKTLRNGNLLRVNLPFTQGEDIYAGIALPGGRLYLLDDFNNFHLFDGNFLLRWNGAGSTLFEISVAPWLPRGEYQLYMLRLPPGAEPWSNTDQWRLGVNSFTVE
ncbi:MAG: hypothetical protein GY862_08495 [Gammaproteobacteria bacterium]|nr:hypothetical protein [Gammaproteobacteria bacterium]